MSIMFRYKSPDVKILEIEGVRSIIDIGHLTGPICRRYSAF